VRISVLIVSAVLAFSPLAGAAEGEDPAPRSSPRSSLPASPASSSAISSISHFRLSKRYGDWRIVDVRIGGVDVTKLFRQQFESLLRTEAPEQMITRLRDRNEQLEARNPLDPGQSRR